MAKLRLGTSYWLDRYSGRAPRFGTMRGRHQADIAIVGGGITGCVAAYLFARAGARVVLVEARPHRPRQHRGEHRPADAGARRRFARPRRRATAPRPRGASGRAAARRCADSPVSCSNCASAPVCRRRRPSTGRATGRPRRILRRELARRHAAGIPGRWLSPAALKRATGIDGAGGILTRGNAQVDPYRSCLGVAQGARDAGAQLFEHSAVRRLKGGPGGVDIELEHGDDTGGLGDRRHRLCDAGVQAARRPVQDDEHLRHRDAAAAVARAPRHGSWAGDAVGHGGAVPLRALDARSAPRVRRPGSAEAASRGAPGCPRSTGGAALGGACGALSGARRHDAGLRVGRAVRDDARRAALHRRAPPVSADSCSRSATAATG